MTFKKLKEKLDKQNIGALKKSEVYVIDADGNKIPLVLKFDTKGSPYFEYETLTETKGKMKIPEISFYQKMQDLCKKHNIVRYPFNRRNLKGFSLMYCEDKQIAWVQGPEEFNALCENLNAFKSTAPFSVSSKEVFDELYETAMDAIEYYLNSSREILPQIRCYSTSIN